MTTLTVTIREGERLVRVAEPVFVEWGTRTLGGWRLTAEWGEPDAEGCYTPTFTTRDDGMVVVKRSALEVQPEALPQPIGAVQRKWWRLGWLSAQAVARVDIQADGIRLAEAVKEVVAHERGSIEEAWQYGDRMLARAKKAEAEIARLRSFGDGR